jgi:hypothetical protein
VSRSVMCCGGGNFGMSATTRVCGGRPQGGRAALQVLILLREKRSMVMQRVTPRRTAIRKLQDQRAKDLAAGDTHSESWPEEFDAQ